MTTLRAFHGDPEVKKRYVTRMKAHIEADELIHGVGWEHGKGCAVGCTLNRYNHAAYERELGIPEILARLEDCLFEGMANGTASTFPLRFLQAPRVGADLSGVASRFMRWLLIDPNHGVIRFADEDGKKAIRTVADLHLKESQSTLQPSAAWSAARSAAGSAARSAVESAARSAAESAARSAAGSAVESAARSAAWSAAESAAGSAARSAAGSAAWSAARSAAGIAAEKNHYEIMAAKLLSFLKAAPVMKK